MLITFQKRVDAIVMLFRRIVDLDQFYAYEHAFGVESGWPEFACHTTAEFLDRLTYMFYGRELWVMLKRSEQLSARRRLGESLARLLKEHEPAPLVDSTTIVFMTEVTAPSAAQIVQSGAEPSSQEDELGGENVR